MFRNYKTPDAEAHHAGAVQCGMMSVFFNVEFLLISYRFIEITKIPFEHAAICYTIDSAMKANRYL